MNERSSARRVPLRVDVVPHAPSRPDASLPPSAERARSGFRRRRALLVVALALVSLLAATVGYGAVLNGQIGRIHVGGLAGEASGRSTGTENVLLVGSTSRCALKRQNPAFGLCSRGVNGINSDVIMVLHLDYAKRSLSLLSIPRDTFVPNARREGANKIDAALFEGPTQLVRAVQSDFGIPVQHYISLNFDTFAGVVDALGGIRMYFPAAVYDAYSGLKIPTPGCRTLDGFHALQVVRARHLQHRTAMANPADPASWPGEDESDLARIRRDHEFLRVLASAVVRQGLGNPITDTRLVRAVAPQLQVDSGMSAGHLISLTRTFHGVNINGAPQLTLPIVNTTFGAYHYKGGNYGDIVWPSQPQDLDVVRHVLDLSADRDTTGGRLPAPAEVTVSVLNGTGLPRAGTTAGRLLTRLGYRVVHIGDTPSVGTRSESVVYYSGPADLGAAEGVLGHLTGHAVLGIDPRLATAGARVTVVTGTDFALVDGAPAGLPSQAATVAPAGQSAAVATGKAPTAPVEALAPYDPRSCTPTSGPGS